MENKKKKEIFFSHQKQNNKPGIIQNNNNNSKFSYLNVKDNYHTLYKNPAYKNVNSSEYK